MVGVAGEQGGYSEGVEESLWSEYSLKVQPVVFSDAVWCEM